MNRLFVRIFLALFLVSIISLIVVPISQSISLQRANNNFEQGFRELVNERTQPGSLFNQRNQRNNNSDSNKNNRNNREDDKNSDRRSDKGGSEARNDNQPNTNEITINESQVNLPPPPINPSSNRPPPPPLGQTLLNTNALEALNANLFAYFGSFRTALRRGVVLGTIIAILACLIVSLLLARSLAKPLASISKAASQLSIGNLDTRVNLKGTWQPTETQALATTFNSMAQNLQDAEEERKAMIADIAHELRNPIASMQFRLEALSDGLIEFNKDESELLQGQIALLSRLIDDLRTLSLADAGQLSLNQEPLALDGLLKGIVTNYQRKAEKTNVKLALNLDSSPTIMGDAQRLTQVISNLLDNAFKVTPEDGSIAISLTQKDDSAIIQVADTGPGLPEDKLANLFDRFVKGERRDIKTAESSGLGLAIVKTLVTLHQGSVTANNRDTGAVFEIKLPIISS